MNKQQKPKRVSIIKPGSLLNKHIPELYVIAEKPRYIAIELFLRNIDYLTPQVRRDLQLLRPMFTAHIKDVIDSTDDPLRQRYQVLSDEKSDLQCMTLTTEVLNWAKKYHLIDRAQTRFRYVEIALQWLYLDSEITEQQRSEGIEVKLIDAIQWDPQLGSDLLKEQNEEIDYWGDYRARHFPFVFSPPAHRLGKASYIHGMTLVDMSNQTPENVIQEMSQILSYDHMRSRLLGNLESNETKIRAHRASIPYSIGRIFNPEEDNWDEFEAEVRHNFEVYLQAYKRIILNTASYDELHEKREPEHFEWLVRFQIEGWKQEKIKEYYSVAHAPTISKALKSTAHIIGLERRRQKRGPDSIQGMRRALAKPHK